MITISDGLEARGWSVTPVDERNKRIANIAPNGDAQWNRDGCIISLSNGSLCRYKGTTSYYAEQGIVLNAVYVPADKRGDGLGSKAVRDLLAAAQECANAYDGTSRIFLEAVGVGGLDCPFGDNELADWYERLGFERDEKRSDENGSIFVIELDPAREG